MSHRDSAITYDNEQSNQPNGTSLTRDLSDLVLSSAVDTKLKEQNEEVTVTQMQNGRASTTFRLSGASSNGKGYALKKEESTPRLSSLSIVTFEFDYIEELNDEVLRIAEATSPPLSDDERTAINESFLLIASHLFEDAAIKLESLKYIGQSREWRTKNERKPIFASILHALGLCLYMTGNNSKATNNFRDAYWVRREFGTEDKSYLDSACSTGVTQYLLGDYSDSVRFFEEALPLARNRHFSSLHRSAMHAYLGCAYFEMGRYEDAIRNLQIANETPPQRFTILYRQRELWSIQAWIGHTFYRAKRLGMAREAFSTDLKDGLAQLKDRATLDAEDEHGITQNIAKDLIWLVGIIYQQRPGSTPETLNNELAHNLRYQSLPQEVRQTLPGLGRLGNQVLLTSDSHDWDKIMKDTGQDSPKHWDKLADAFHTKKNICPVCCKQGREAQRLPLQKISSQRNPPQKTPSYKALAPKTTTVQQRPPASRLSVNRRSASKTPAYAPQVPKTPIRGLSTQSSSSSWEQSAAQGTMQPKTSAIPYRSMMTTDNHQNNGTGLNKATAFKHDQTPAARLIEIFADQKRAERMFTDHEMDEIHSILELQKSHWRGNPRTYAVLRIIDHLDEFASIEESGFSDIEIPVAKANCLPFRDRNARLDFVKAQSFVLSNEVDLENEAGAHHYHIGDDHAIPFGIVHKLGVGAYGQVDKVKNTKTLNVFALKKMLRDKFFDESKLRMKSFVIEKQILQNIGHKHDHIVNFVGSYTSPKHYGLLISPAAEMDLEMYLATLYAPNRAGELRTFFGCLMSALEFLHDHEIRHKDIKPANILYDSSNILFTDFGIAKDFGIDNQSATAGPAGGTRRYAAPEVRREEERGRSSDVWSLGIVFLEMASTLKGKPIKWLRDLPNEGLPSDSTDGSSDDDADAAFKQVIAALAETGSRDDNVVFGWIQAMLCRDKKDRPDAFFLMKQIVHPRHVKFCGTCCSGGEDEEDDDDDDEEHEQQLRSGSVRLSSRRKSGGGGNSKDRPEHSTVLRRSWSRRESALSAKLGL